MQTLTFKATTADATAFRAAAQQKGVSFSDFARDTLRAAVDKEPRKFNNILTPGHVVFDGPPITSEDVYAALYD